MSGNDTRRVQVMVNGRRYVVEVGDVDASPLVVTVDGQPYQVTIEPDKLEKPPPAAEEVAAGPQPPQPPVPPAANRPAAMPAGPRVSGPVKAPMPGTILGVSVKAGDSVARRQTLCTLEAMKMRNAICAPRDGVIASVEVADGQTVAKGQVLFTLA